MDKTRHTNRLVNETSPYLLQHAHNPVDWYPWGSEAFNRAQAENRPILLSIGYSACHWCHVMERESFEDEAIARLMNENFIPIKVDREERPDLDHIYQTVGQMLTGQGGWPLTMFLTPELEPFWGGTYFPPEDRFGRPGFRRVLQSVAQHYQREPDRVRSAADEIREALEQINRIESGSLHEDLLNEAAHSLARAFDLRNGGFGSQPKFPNTMSLELFLRHWNNSGDTEFLRMSRLSLRKMAEGGIYDQIGGGFHRYSTDAKWLVPHFEKMLYDNALLARLYTDAWLATRDPLFERVVHETLAYVVREMTSPEGGFYSTQDADSEGEEGKFFVWTPSEVAAAIGENDAALLCDYYGVTSGGNFEHQKSILNITGSFSKLAGDFGIGEDEAERHIQTARSRLFQTRETRVKPFLDDKILTGWNGLMISAFAAAGGVFKRQDYVDTAANASRFVLDRLEIGERLCRSYRAGRSSGEAYLDDYAFIIAGLLDVYEATWEGEWLQHANALAEKMITLFKDDATGDFFFTPEGSEAVLVRPRQNADQSIPSGVSAAVLDLLRLSSLMGRPDWRELAHGVMRANAEIMRANPHGGGNLICAFDLFEHGPMEVVLRGALQDPDFQAGAHRLKQQYAPNRLIVAAAPGDDYPPILRGKESVSAVTAYVCKEFSCSPPVHSWEDLDRVLGELQ